MASEIADDGLRVNKMPQFIKDWKPSTSQIIFHEEEAAGMFKWKRRNLEQYFFILIDYCIYMAARYGGN